MTFFYEQNTFKSNCNVCLNVGHNILKEKIKGFKKQRVFTLMELYISSSGLLSLVLGP